MNAFQKTVFYAQGLPYYSPKYRGRIHEAAERKIRRYFSNLGLIEYLDIQWERSVVMAVVRGDKPLCRKMKEQVDKSCTGSIVISWEQVPGQLENEPNHIAKKRAVMWYGRPELPFGLRPEYTRRLNIEASERLEEFLQRETFDAEQEIFQLEQDFKNNLKIVEESEDTIVKDELEEELEEFEETVLSITKPLLVRIDDDSDDEENDKYRVKYKKQDRFTADEVVELLRLRMMQTRHCGPLTTDDVERLLKM